MHLRHPSFKYSVFETLNKNRNEELKKLKRQKSQGKFIKTKQRNLEKSRDLPGKIALDNALRDEAFNIVKNRNYDGYQRGLTSVIHNFFNEDFECKQRNMS